MASPSVGEHVTDCASRIESVRRDVRLCVSLRVARLGSAHRGGGCRRRRCCMGCAESDRCCLLFAIHSPLTHCAHTHLPSHDLMHRARHPLTSRRHVTDNGTSRGGRTEKKSRPHDASCSRAVATTVQRQHTHRNERNRGEGGMQAHVHTRPHMTQHSDHRHTLGTAAADGARGSGYSQKLLCSRASNQHEHLSCDADAICLMFKPFRSMEMLYQDLIFSLFRATRGEVCIALRSSRSCFRLIMRVVNPA